MGFTIAAVEDQSWLFYQGDTDWMPLGVMWRETPVGLFGQFRENINELHYLKG
jgi:hypothetical protein